MKFYENQDRARPVEVIKSSAIPKDAFMNFILETTKSGHLKNTIIRAKSETALVDGELVEGTITSDSPALSDHIHCANVLKKRRARMRRHKHKKRLRKNRYKGKK